MESSINIIAPEEERKGSKWQWLQARYLVILATFLSNTVMYFMRINLSVAIVAITTEPEQGTQRTPDVPQYDWDGTAKGLVLSSFFWGYVVAQVPSASLAHKYGPKLIMFITILINAVFSFLFVPAAALGWEYACASRVVLGLAQGALIPCCHMLIATWSLPSERGRMSMLTYTGQQFGTVVAMAASGVISDQAGWPVVFYISGGLGLALAIVWQILAADTPALSRFASPQERHLIESSISAAAGSHQVTQKLKTPWVGIFTSLPVWSLFAAHSAFNWGFSTLATEIPSYMSGVLNFEITQNGFLSSLPYLAMCIAGPLLSWISDFMLNRNCCNLAASRKINNSIAQYGSAILMVVLGYASTDATLAVTLLTLAVACSAASMIGFQVNFIDISPNFAGDTVAISNCIGNIFCIFSPIVVSLIVTEEDNAAQWRTVFFIAAGFYFVGNTIFVLFGSVEVQPWNNPDWKRGQSASDVNENKETGEDKSNMQRY